MATSSRIRTEFKVVLVGDPGVGKTSLLQRAEGRRQENDNVEIFDVDSDDVILHIWDLPNLRKGIQLPREFFHCIDAAVIMYDLTNKDTFWNVYNWIEKLRQNRAAKGRKFLVGGKSDLKDGHEVYPYDYETLADEENMKSFLISSRTGHQISKLFEDIAISLTLDEEEAQEDSPGKSSEVVFLGSPEVGKSTLITKYNKDIFLEENHRSVNVDAVHCITDIGNSKIQMKMVDNCGQSGSTEKCKAACQNAIVAVLVFDVTKEKSFKELPQLMEFIKENCPNVKETFLVGNKSDLVENAKTHETHRVKSRDIQQLAKSFNVRDYEVSAKTGNGVEGLFQAIASSVNRHGRMVTGRSSHGGGRSTIFKGIVVGEYNVGKTSFLERCAKIHFRDNAPTTSPETVALCLPIDDHEVRIECFDTAGMERGTARLPPQFYHESDVAIVMYDIANEYTFRQVEFWLDEVRKNCQEDVKIFLVGGKCDLAERQVEFDEAEALAEENDLEFFETSSRYGLRVKTLLNAIAKYLVTRGSKYDNTVIERGNKSKGNSYCCSI